MPDNISATPRNKFLGLLADGLRNGSDFLTQNSLPDNVRPYNIPSPKGLLDMLGIPAVANTLNEMSYGGLLGTGSGMTWKPKSDTVDAALAVAPLLAKAPKVANAGLNLLGDSMASNVVRQPNMGQAGAVVWHGSPYNFNKFDSSKIGTGEGAQAYGHGLYLAENKGVASGYKDKLSPATINRIQADEYTIAGDPQFILKLHDANGNVTKTPYLSPNEFEKWVGPDAAKMLREKGDGDYKNLNIDFGNLYKVDLPDEHIAKMLDYDNIVPESVREPLSQSALNQFGSGISTGQGSQLLKQVADEFKFQGHPNPNAAASEWLKSQGIPGVRYLDGGSRGAGTGSSNFVVFPGNEGLLSILERNGQSLK
jgi:hypothetical protein